MRIAVTGAGGQLGFELARALGPHEALLLDEADLDVTDGTAVEGVLRSAMPEAIIHAAAWTDVDGCERDPDRANTINAVGTANVARAAGDALLVLISTDYVFDGAGGRPYTETDDPNPIQVYGRTKLAAEQEVRAAQRWAVVRTAWLYGATYADGSPARNFIHSVLAGLRRGPVEVVDDQVGSPTSAHDLAVALVALVDAGATGVFHAVNDGIVSRFELARTAAAIGGFDEDRVRPTTTVATPRAAPRPPYAPLRGEAWVKAGFEPLAPWEDALRRALPAFLGVA